METSSVTAEIERRPAEAIDQCAVHPTGQPEQPLQIGDVVELKSGSFPMTIEYFFPDPGKVIGQTQARCVWDVNGIYSGKPARLQSRSLPLCAHKRWIAPDSRDTFDNLPF